MRKSRLRSLRQSMRSRVGSCYRARVLSKNTNGNVVRQITVQSQRSVTIFRPMLGREFSDLNAFAAQNSRSIKTPARDGLGRGAFHFW